MEEKITEGGMLLAVYALLLFITVQIPFLGILRFFFLPVPFILVMIKEKLSWLFGFLAVASVIDDYIWNDFFRSFDIICRSCWNRYRLSFEV